MCQLSSMISMAHPQPYTPIRQFVCSFSRHSQHPFISESWMTALGDGPSSSLKISTVVCDMNWSISSPWMSLKPLPSRLNRLLKWEQGYVSISCSSRTVKPVFWTMGYLSELILNSWVPSAKGRSVQTQGRKEAMLASLGKETTVLSNSILLLAMNLLLKIPQLIFLCSTFFPPEGTTACRCLLSTASKFPVSLLESPSMVFLRSSQLSLALRRTWQLWAEKLSLMSPLMQVGLFRRRRHSLIFSRLQTFMQERMNSFSGQICITFASSSFRAASNFTRRCSMAELRYPRYFSRANFFLAATPRLSTGYFSSWVQCLSAISSAGQQQSTQSLGWLWRVAVVRQRSLGRRQCGLRHTRYTFSSIYNRQRRE